MLSFHVPVAMFLLLLCMLRLPIAKPESASLRGLIAKLKADTLLLAREVEALYADRCTIALDNCAFNNYDTCLSTLPNQTCLVSNDFIIDACNGCGASFDYSTSTVSLPTEVDIDQHFNPTDNQVIETICFSRKLDDWFLQKHANDTSYWRELDLESPQMYYGSTDGVMRMFPGRRRQLCEFDPRVRPWYVAASSGPKNIILVLDTSGSITEDLLFLLKKAAQLIIETLTVSDRVAIVRFDANVEAIVDGNGLMFVATNENKDYLKAVIGNFTNGAGTHFYAAFEAAFNVMNVSIANERARSCNSAILFFTDGVMNEPGKDESDVQQLVETRLQDTSNKTGHPVLLFTYSIQTTSDDPHSFPKQLACSTDIGVWSKISNSSELFESLTSYYRLFSIGLSNQDFVAWVEPYLFATGGVGTTVSAPVYDGSRLVGVVGIDLTRAAINKVLGVESGSDDTLDAEIARSTANCPVLNLSLCELESFRRQGSAGNDALCSPGNCTESELMAVEPKKCSNESSYPPNVWNNTDNEEKKFEEAICCNGANITLEQCFSNGEFNSSSIGPSEPPMIGPTTGLPTVAATSPTTGPEKDINKGIIVGPVIGGVVLATIIWWMKCRPVKGLDPSQFYPDPSSY